MKAFEQMVERGVAGSRALEDAVEAGAQERGLFGVRGELVVFQATIEPPDHPLGDLDGVALVIVGGNELVNKPLGVNPAQRVHADAELAGVVGDDHRPGEQALDDWTAPHSAASLASKHGVRQDPQLRPRPSACKWRSHSPEEAKDARLMGDELVDHDLRQIAPFHIVERGLALITQSDAAAKRR